MKFFVDTADVSAIRELNDLGMVDGVTTNPSLILKSGRDITEVTREICDIVEGPVSAEVVALEADAMIAEGRKLAEIAPNITVKLPLTWDGLKACKVLSGEGKMVNVTLVFQRQPSAFGGESGCDLHLALHRAAGRSGAGRVRVDRGYPHHLRQLRVETQILAASIRSVNHVLDVARIGADVMTAPPEVIRKLASHPLTDAGLAQFMKDWEKTGQKIL